MAVALSWETVGRAVVNTLKERSDAEKRRECGVRLKGPLQPALTQLIACDKTDLGSLMGEFFYIRKKMFCNNFL